jgi:glycyl-tRNA synthetase
MNLSRDEDSVTSLAVAPQTTDDEHSLVVLAGINSSVAEQKKNNNQHMRAFRFEAPRKVQALASDMPESDKEGKKEKKDETIPGKATQLSKASLFRSKTGESGDTYQRVLRLSPWRKQADASEESTQDTRVGAIATGLAPSGEIVLFRATESPSESDVIGRIQLGANEEADDIDFANLEDDADQGKETPGQFRVAYTNGVDVMAGDISSRTRSNAAPELFKVFTIPLPSSGARAARPKIRSLRFLSPTAILMLQNAPNRSGCELILLQLPAEKGAQTKVLRRRKLPRGVKIGLGLDVCPLGRNPVGQQQTIIAVSGSDHSISLLTLEYGPNKGYGKIQPYTTLRDVHPFSMTKLCFSTFIAPAHPITPEVGPQKVKLASVSMGNTVVVHTLPLQPFPPSSRTPRYVLTLPGPAEFWEGLVFSLALLVSFLVICTALLTFAEIRGATPPYLGAANYLPDTWRENWAVEYQAPPNGRGSYFDTLFTPQRTETVAQVTSDELESLKDILDRVHSAGAAPADIETVAPHSLSVTVRCNKPGLDAEQSVIIETSTSHDHGHEEARLRAWQEMNAMDQDAWKRRLEAAGRWTPRQGESVLQGVLFSDACGHLREWVADEL